MVKFSRAKLTVKSVIESRGEVRPWLFSIFDLPASSPGLGDGEAVRIFFSVIFGHLWSRLVI